MPKIELTPENIKDLGSIDRYPEIAAAVYGIVLQTQLAIAKIRTGEELSFVLASKEEALKSILRQGDLPEGDPAIYKTSQVIINLCLRAMPEVTPLPRNNHFLTISLPATSSDISEH